MKKIVRIITTLCLIVLSLTLFACEKKDEEKLSSYDIKAVYDEQTRTIEAKMTVNYVNASDAILDEVCFHLYPQAYRENARFKAVSDKNYAAAYANGASYGGITIDSLAVNGESKEITIAGEDEDILVVSLEENKLQPTQSVKIEMDFSLALPCVRHRFGYDGRTVNLGNWYPIACVYENGNFVTSPYYSSGDPFYSDCADYSVSLTVPDGLTAALSGKSVKTVNGDKTITFSSSIKSARDYAAVIGEFTMLGTSVNGVDINYYYSNDETPQSSLTAARDAIKTYSELFGNYPYESFSVVKTHFLHGGMEYPSLVYVSDAVNAEMQTEVIAHEAAHQWWYAVVGNNQVDNAWMDEGLTEFTTGMFYEKNPTYGVNNEKRTADALSAYVFYYDTFKNKTADTSMTRKVCDYASEFEYTYMNYVKGSLMFDALRLSVGEDKFVSSLKEYYTTYKFKNATPDELIGCFERNCGKDMKNFFSSWLEGKVKTYGSHGGKA